MSEKVCDLANANGAKIFGYRWLYGQLDDRVEMVNDVAANTSGIAPAGSVRASFLDRIRPFQCNYDLSGVEFLQTDVRLKLNGSASDLTNPLKLQMARIPQYWTIGYLGVNGYVYRLFSETYRSGWEEVKSFGYPRYKGKVDGTKLLSYSGVYPTASINLINADVYARNTNAAGRTTPFYIYQHMFWLTVLDTGRFNMQAYYAGITAAGASYANAAPTGRLNTLLTPSGQIAHEYQTGLFTNAFRWRFVEEFFGQIWNILSGIYVVWQPGWTMQKVYVAKTPGQITTNNNYSGMTLIGEIPKSDGYIKEFLPGTILPGVITGASTTTGKCDYSYASGSTSAFVNTAFVGGYSHYGGGAGPGYFSSNWAAGNANASVGASFVLPELPEAAAQPPGV